MKTLRMVLHLCAVILAVWGTPQAGWGQIPAGVGGPFHPNAEAEAAIARLKSPFCPGLMLEVCPSPAAGELRDSMQSLAAQGWSRDSLVAWMLNQYGDEYLAVPEAEGRGLLAWVVPPAVLVLGLAAVVVVLQRVRQSRPDEQAPGLTLSEEQEQLLGSALKELEAFDEPN